jgi:hypothetical protein
MGVAKGESAHKLLRWSAPIVVGHFLVVIWHLVLLVKVQPNTPRFVPPLLIVFNLFPVAGLLALSKGFPKLAGSLITAPLGTALIVGAYSHFVSLGPDNVLRMPTGALRLSFQISALLLLALEFFACWLGIQMFAVRMRKTAATV